MRGKLAFVLGAAVGYVLGSRAGRERYEQIKRGAQHVWNTEPVQQGVQLVKGAVDDRADDLKAFAIRVGNDVFSNLAGARQKSDPFATADEAAADRSDKTSEPKPKAKSTKASSTKAKPKPTGRKAGS